MVMRRKSCTPSQARVRAVADELESYLRSHLGSSTSWRMLCRRNCLSSIGARWTALRPTDLEAG